MEGPLLSEANESFSKGEAVEASCKDKYGDAERKACYEEALSHYRDAGGLYETLYTFARDSGGCFDRDSCQEITKPIELVQEKINRIVEDTTTMS